MVKNTFEKVLKEIDTSFILLVFLRSAARSLIVFLILFLILSTIGLSWTFALFFSVVWFAIVFPLESKKDPYKIIEEKDPHLEDMLRAAKDNLDENNELVKELHHEVRSKLRSVKTSSLVDSSKLKKDLIFAAILSLIIVLIAPFNPVLLNLEFNLGEFGIDTGDVLIEANNKKGAAAGVNRDIFGEKSIAVLGDEELDLTFSFGEDKVDISNIKKPEQLEFKSSYPDEIGAVASSSFEENIPEEQQEVIKNYYKKITEERS
jgi:hypothetical protein